ncbi:MAG: hypothetical protein LAP39_05685 [Acidobacteriia bacterium]|nr:hypothetical protein [Terriglobia bacterium]
MRPSILIAAICQLSWMAVQPAVAEPAKSSFATGIESSSLEVIHKYLNSQLIRQAATRGAEMEADIEATLPKLKKAGTLRAHRRISCAGQVIYRVLDYSGDPGVKREVISRYLAAESEERDAGSIAITPANYEFRLKAARGPEGQAVWIFRLKPRKKRVGLFKGELWLDAETGMPLHEAGQFVKVPSIFLKRIRFARDYGIRDGVSIPTSIDSTVETRLVGRAELHVRFYNLMYDGTGSCNSATYLGVKDLFVTLNDLNSLLRGKIPEWRLPWERE